MIRRRTKYGADPSWDPILHRKFHSKAERRYALYLFASQQKGEIRDLDFQVRVPLVFAHGLDTGNVCIIDFKYFDERLGEIVYDEFKGAATRAWRIKKKLWAAGAGPGLLRVTTRQAGLYHHEDIYPVDQEVPR